MERLRGAKKSKPTFEYKLVGAVFTKLLSKVSGCRRDWHHIIESGQVDAAIVITAEMDKSKFTVIPLASSESASFRLNAAVVKSLIHANEAKELVALLLSPEAQSVYCSYGYDNK